MRIWLKQTEIVRALVLAWPLSLVAAALLRMIPEYEWNFPPAIGDPFAGFLISAEKHSGILGILILIFVLPWLLLPGFTGDPTKRADNIRAWMHILTSLIITAGGAWFTLTILPRITYRYGVWFEDHVSMMVAAVVGFALFFFLVRRPFLRARTQRQQRQVISAAPETTRSTAAEPAPQQRIRGSQVLVPIGAMACGMIAHAFDPEDPTIIGTPVFEATLQEVVLSGIALLFACLPLLICVSLFHYERPSSTDDEHRFRFEDSNFNLYQSFLIVVLLVWGLLAMLAGVFGTGLSESVARQTSAFRLMPIPNLLLRGATSYLMPLVLLVAMLLLSARIFSSLITIRSDAGLPLIRCRWPVLLRIGLPILMILMSIFDVYIPGLTPIFWTVGICTMTLLAPVVMPLFVIIFAAHRYNDLLHVIETISTPPDELHVRPLSAPTPALPLRKAPPTVRGETPPRQLPSFDAPPVRRRFAW
ncbi:MAG: hypothetical protein ACOC0P_00790 [Planctomycetota bacterium]